jgi:hypothetical protein
MLYLENTSISVVTQGVILLNVIMLILIMQNVIMLIFIMLNVIMLILIMLNVIMLIFIMQNIIYHNRPLNVVPSVVLQSAAWLSVVAPVVVHSETQTQKAF